MTSTPAAPTRLTSRYWATRRSAAVAGIAFAVLLLAAMTMMRLALADGSLATLHSDAASRRLISWSLHLVPFAGIAFLWFIGVVRDQLGDVEDRLFSTVFLGSGLLFLAMLFTAASTTTSLIAVTAATPTDAGLWDYGSSSAHALMTTFAMRMAAVFVISVSTVGLRTRALPRWVSVVGYAVALVLLVTADVQKWVQLLFPLWVLLVSLAILVTSPPVRPTDEADAA